MPKAGKYGVVCCCTPTSHASWTMEKTKKKLLTANGQLNERFDKTDRVLRSANVDAVVIYLDSLNLQASVGQNL